MASNNTEVYNPYPIYVPDSACNISAAQFRNNFAMLKKLTDCFSQLVLTLKIPKARCPEVVELEGTNCIEIDLVEKGCDIWIFQNGQLIDNSGDGTHYATINNDSTGKTKIVFMDKDGNGAPQGETGDPCVFTIIAFDNLTPKDCLTCFPAPPTQSNYCGC